MAQVHRPLRLLPVLGLPIAWYLLAALPWSTPADGRQPPVAPPSTPLSTSIKLPEFTAWPKDARPEAVIVITGQTYGYLQPCGCSRPQLGGLERRANFMAALRASGWPTVGLDLGDVLPMAGVVPEQVLLKYAASMNALREMGYLAVGAGQAEFANGLYQVLARYAEVKEQPPFTLAGNVGGLLGGRVNSRANSFPGPGKRPMVGLAEVTEVGKVPVGVACVVSASVAKAVDALGPKTLIGFTAPNDTLAEAVKELEAHPKKPRVNVLLCQGNPEEAKALAKAWPQFSVVVCLSADSEPPETAETLAGADGRKTLIVQIGYKGRYVGVVGVFKKPDGTLDLKYQRVALGEEFVTPGDEETARKTNPVLKILDEYAAEVKSRNLMNGFPQGPHPGTARVPGGNLAFVGSEKCMNCHTAEFDKWKTTQHSHALEALEKVAKRPAQRNYDGECVVCHTTGFGYKTGYRDELTTPQLKHVGCESCHGPGSAHAADPKDAKLLQMQSPWRKDKSDRLPDLATVESIGRLSEGQRAQQVQSLTPAQRRMVSAVTQACTSCHDSENDPRFDFYTYWPKVHHAAKK